MVYFTSLCFLVCRPYPVRIAIHPTRKPLYAGDAMNLLYGQLHLLQSRALTDRGHNGSLFGVRILCHDSSISSATVYPLSAKLLT